jgi:hypothetical protein
MTATPDYLAQNQSEGSWAPEGLRAGDQPLKTRGGETLVTGQNLARLTIVAYDATNKLTQWDHTAVADADASGDTVNLPTSVAYPVGVLIEATDATSADKTVSLYTEGCFNHELLVWPSALDTLAKRRAALTRFHATFSVDKLPA